MTPEIRLQYQRQLSSLQKQLLEKGPHKIEPNRTSDYEPGDEEDEVPLNEMLQSIASDRNRNAAGMLRLVAKALKKLREAPDDFGLCEECEEEIEERRLDAMPYSDLCVDCQSKRDHPKGQPTRRSLFDFK